MPETEYSNRLIYESSPYLLQHAHNPVDWYPWGEEAFQKAKSEDKPILLSCGYSACHWCHVMERESFENPGIASLMNRYFVNIKVDREERPDIDELYQQAVQVIGGQGGWPLTVFLDQQKRPFFGGTYFPPSPMYGRMSFPQLVQVVHEKWQRQRDDIADACKELANFLQSPAEKEGTTPMPARELPLKAAAELYQMIDPKNGGFGNVPKFPNPSLMQLFLRLGVAYKQSPLLEHIYFTLKQMAKGGIYDQLGGGFHRYSTDAGWLIPHFEKMLYDNAQLLRIYTMAYQLTRLNEFKDVVCQTADYIRREMTAPEGGFYATQDADSEGVEGEFFVWKLPEIETILGAEAAELVADYYRLSVDGNFEGANVLNRLVEPQKYKAAELHAGLGPKLEQAKSKLFQVRETRVKPFRDEKVITSWNGLMIGALAYVYQVFGRNEDYKSAVKAAQFVWNSLRLPDGGLARIYKDGRAKVQAMLDDYTFLAQAYIDLYEADFDQVWLQRSLELTEAVRRNFGRSDGYYYTTAESGGLIARPLSGMDQAIPSGVSAHCENLLKLAAYTGRNDLNQEAERILTAYGGVMKKEIWAYAGLISVLDMHFQGLGEFTFISEGEQVPELLEKLRQTYIPYRVLSWRNALHKDVAAHPAKELFLNRRSMGGKPTCYPCFGNRCFDPVTDWDALNGVIAAQSST